MVRSKSNFMTVAASVSIIFDIYLGFFGFAEFTACNKHFQNHMDILLYKMAYNTWLRNPWPNEKLIGHV